MLASSSLWVVPFATSCVGRLADHLPRARLLSAGVFLWCLATIATGLSSSFEACKSHSLGSFQRRFEGAEGRKH